MPGARDNPFTALSTYIVERNYHDAGCDKWNAREVKLLCAKFGDTLDVMAARLRLRPAEFMRRMETDGWTKQDGLILTMLEQTIHFRRGDELPKAPLIVQALASPP